MKTYRSKCLTLRGWSAILIFSLLSPSLFAQNEKALEAFMSYGFAEQLTVSGQSEKIAWVVNKEGVRNIWMVESPGRNAIQLTDYKEDDGQAISNLQFSNDHQNIIYVRGSGPNRRGDIPNPALLTNGASRDIWMVNISSKRISKLGRGSAPQMHPTDDLIAYAQSGKIYTIDLNTDRGAYQLFQVRGSASNLRWSPTGRKLAFVNNRGDHGFIGVYDIITDSYQYISPSVDRDQYPVWSPDGSKLAFARFPNERNQLIFEPHRSGLPWSIMIYDVQRNTTTQLWKAEKGQGSVYRFISATDQFFWGANNYLVFPYEGNGWTNLYAISTQTKIVRNLTPGKFEVQFVSRSPDGNTILYSSNQNDLDRQHIWKVDIRGGEPIQLTSGDGVEWSPKMTAAGRVAFLGSGPTEPAEAKAINTNDKVISLAPAINKAYPSKDLVEPEQVIFKSTDGMNIHAQLFKPKNINAGQQLPALLFFHGGSRRQMLLAFHHRGYYHNAYAMNQYLANQGYIVLSVNYRSGIGYGMEFREALEYGASGASEFRDVKGAGLYLQSRSDVNPSKIGLWGGSYGGYLTALGLARASDLFAAGVDIHGVHDWNKVVNNFIPSYNPLERPEWSKLAYESSPLSDITKWTSPVLFIHGDDDRNVPFSETVDMVEDLRRKDIEPEQLVFPDEVHGFLLHKNWVRAYQATIEFFNRHLKD